MPIFIPLLVLAGAAVGSALFASGCGSAKPPPKPNPCDAFKKPPEHHFADDDSYRALNFLWPSKLDAARVENWDARARVYLGAADALFRPLCERRSTMEAEANTAKYAEASRTFFEGHYASKAQATDDGVLVLIAGLAPAALDETIMKGAMESLTRENTSQAEFAKLLVAAQRFNRAAAVARVDRKTRYSTPKASCNLKPAERKTAKELVARAEEEAKRLDASKLNDKQRALLTGFVGAADVLKKSLQRGCAKKCNNGCPDSISIIEESQEGTTLRRIRIRTIRRGPDGVIEAEADGVELQKKR